MTSPAFRFWLLTGALVVVNLAWAGFALLTWFGVEIPSGADTPLMFWLLWELVSIAVTFLVTVLFWISYFIQRSGSIPIFEGGRVRHATFGVLCLLAFLSGFVGAALCALSNRSLSAQVWLLALGVAGTIGVQLLAMVSTFDALRTRNVSLNDAGATNRIKIAREVCAILGNRDNVSKYLCFSDLPIGTAIALLACAVTFHPSNSLAYEEGQMRAFVAGAIALQLLYSNFVFWLEAAADYRPGYEFLGRLPTPLRSIREILHPADQGAGTNGDELLAWARSALARLFPADVGAASKQAAQANRAEGASTGDGTNLSTKGD